MDSSDSNDDSYQKDSLLDLLTKQKTGRTHQDNRISIDFANQVMTLGLYKPPKQLYIQNTCHTKEIHVSVIKDQRAKSLISINILSKGVLESSRRIRNNFQAVDQFNMQAEAMVQRVYNTVRRKSCHCSYCGLQAEFQRRMNTFRVRTQQSINTDVRLLRYNSRNPHKQQSMMRFHKIKQLQAKYHSSSQSTQMENQIQIEFTPKVSHFKLESKRKIQQPQPVVLQQFMQTSKNYFIKQYLIGQADSPKKPKTLPSLKILTQSRRDISSIDLNILQFNYQMSQAKRTRASSQSDSIQRKSIKKYSSDYYDSDASDSEPMIKKRIVKIWTPEEDEMLQNFYEQYQGNWGQVAASIPGRNPSQCSQRWKRINPNRIKMRKQWTEEEDRQVLRLIAKFGKNWKRIENEMNGRSGKQIRERFINKLDKSINHDQFTEQEDEKIYQLYEKMGPRWSEISKMLSGRPENMVKNRFYSHIKKVYNIVGKESDSDWKEQDIKDNKPQLEYQQSVEKKLDTIPSMYDYEGSLNYQVNHHNNIMFPQFESLIKQDSLNSNGELLFHQQMSLEQKQLYGMDVLGGSGQQIFQDIQLPGAENYDEPDLGKKLSSYFRVDSENTGMDNSLTNQFTKMSMEQE